MVLTKVVTSGSQPLTAYKTHIPYSHFPAAAEMLPTLNLSGQELQPGGANALSAPLLPTDASTVLKGAQASVSREEFLQALSHVLGQLDVLWKHVQRLEREIAGSGSGKPSTPMPGPPPPNLQPTPGPHDAASTPIPDMTTAAVQRTDANFHSGFLGSGAAAAGRSFGGGGASGSYYTAPDTLPELRAEDVRVLGAGGANGTDVGLELRKSGFGHSPSPPHVASHLSAAHLIPSHGGGLSLSAVPLAPHLDLTAPLAVASSGTPSGTASSRQFASSALHLPHVAPTSIAIGAGRGVNLSQEPDTQEYVSVNLPNLSPISRSSKISKDGSTGPMLSGTFGGEMLQMPTDSRAGAAGSSSGLSLWDKNEPNIFPISPEPLDKTRKTERRSFTAPLNSSLNPPLNAFNPLHLPTGDVVLLPATSASDPAALHHGLGHASNSATVFSSNHAVDQHADLAAASSASSTAHAVALNSLQTQMEYISADGLNGPLHLSVFPSTTMAATTSTIPSSSSPSAAMSLVASKLPPSSVFSIQQVSSQVAAVAMQSAPPAAPVSLSGLPTSIPGGGGSHLLTLSAATTTTNSTISASKIPSIADPSRRTMQYSPSPPTILEDDDLISPQHRDSSSLQHQAQPPPPTSSHHLPFPSSHFLSLSELDAAVSAGSASVLLVSGGHHHTGGESHPQTEAISPILPRGTLDTWVTMAAPASTSSNSSNQFGVDNLVSDMFVSAAAAAGVGVSVAPGTCVCILCGHLVPQTQLEKHQCANAAGGGGGILPSTSNSAVVRSARPGSPRHGESTQLSVNHATPAIGQPPPPSPSSSSATEGPPITFHGPAVSAHLLQSMGEGDYIPSSPAGSQVESTGGVIGLSIVAAGGAGNGSLSNSPPDTPISSQHPAVVSSLALPQPPSLQHPPLPHLVAHPRSINLNPKTEPMFSLHSPPLSLASALGVHNLPASSSPAKPSPLLLPLKKAPDRLVHLDTAASLALPPGPRPKTEPFPEEEMALSPISVASSAGAVKKRGVPHICTLCGKRFSKKWNLQLHQLTHSGKKPYVCRFCSKAFSRTNILKKHETTHHPEEANRALTLSSSAPSLTASSTTIAKSPSVKKSRKETPKPRLLKSASPHLSSSNTTTSPIKTLKILSPSPNALKGSLLDGNAIFKDAVIAPKSFGHRGLKEDSASDELRHLEATVAKTTPLLGGTILLSALPNTLVGSSIAAPMGSSVVSASLLGQPPAKRMLQQIQHEMAHDQQQQQQFEKSQSQPLHLDKPYPVLQLKATTPFEISSQPLNLEKIHNPIINKTQPLDTPMFSLKTMTPEMAGISPAKGLDPATGFVSIKASPESLPPPPAPPPLTQQLEASRPILFESSRIVPLGLTVASAPPDVKPAPRSTPEKRRSDASESKTPEESSPKTNAKKYSCGECGKKFSWEKNLKVHLRSHTNEPKPYGCDFCSKRFTRRQHAKHHLILQHAAEAAAAGIVVSTSSTPTPLVEKRSLEEEIALAETQRLVANIQRTPVFGCPICRRAFSQVSELERHVSTHNGSKPHACLVCGKGFSRKEALKEHRMTQHADAKSAAPVLQEIGVESAASLLDSATPSTPSPGPRTSPPTESAVAATAPLSLAPQPISVRTITS